MVARQDLQIQYRDIDKYTDKGDRPIKQKHRGNLGLQIWHFNQFTIIITVTFYGNSSSKITEVEK